MPEAKKKRFTTELLRWYALSGRHDLPWQKPDWYARIVSEVMLQQTQVVTVLPRYEAFMSAFPRPEDLARASEDEVMALWAGLGYYSRARNLQKAVRVIVDEKAGRCPESAQALAELPGIGPSTAGAVASFVFGERAVMADGNAQRVLSRVFLIEGNATEKCFKQAVWACAASLLPESRDMADYTQALMDLGALVCRRRPDCRCCPVADICDANQKGVQTAFPGKKPKRERPVRHAAALFAFEDDRIWLQKREGRGVWKGLWAVPVLESENPEPNVGELLTRCGIRREDVRLQSQLGDLTHDFTHYRLIIHPVMIELRPGTLPADARLFTFEETADIGLPTPIKTLLQLICGSLRL